MFDAKQLKNDFPILSRTIHGKPLVYLDSAATSQKPQAVLHAIQQYYELFNANVHRGIHKLGDESTRRFYEARKEIAEFFGADAHELILTRNTTEAINALAYMWAEHNISKDDVILCTEMEHHSNLVPWQEFAKRRGCAIGYVEVTEDGELDLIDVEDKLSGKMFGGKNVKLFSVTHVSNTLGTKNPIEKIVSIAKKHDVAVLVDGAQSAPHIPINFHDLGCDFFACSAHKMLGPMGIGGLLVQKERLNELRPYLFGGGMIAEVTLESTTYAELPDKFIAGTPDVASAIGWAEACRYLENLGMQYVAEHDRSLVAYALEKLVSVPEMRIIGPRNAHNRVGSVAFMYEGVHAHDVAQVLDSEGVAVRSGHHCTMPLHHKFCWQATTRASFNVYNTTEDIDVLVESLNKVKEVFGK